jgi:hypothetical protein
MSDEAINQTIQTARDLADGYRAELGPCCICGGVGDWSITRDDYICNDCVRRAHAEHRY